MPRHSLAGSKPQTAHHRGFLMRHDVVCYYAMMLWAIRTHQEASLRQIKVTRPCKTIKVGSAMR